MSNQKIRNPGRTLFLFFVLLMLMGLTPPAGHGGEASGSTYLHPLLVRVRQGDTPATLARQYLNDASKEWLIREHNGRDIFSEGEAVTVPRANFRPGGLYPDGIQVVPVLVYTDVGGNPQKKDRFPRLAFHDQMQWLKAEGFIAVTPAQLIEFMAFSGQLPQRSVLITVDTESRSFYNQAVPVLKEFGWVATLFLATGRVGEKGAMTWGQLRHLQNEGFTIGCRGQYGRSLTRRKKDQSFRANFKWIEAELRQSKKEIETQLGKPCLFLAYPEGGSSGLVSAMAANIGFSAAFNRLPGGTPFFGDRFGIHRIAIDNHMDMDRFSSLFATTLSVDLN